MLSQLLARQEELTKAEVPTVKQEPDKLAQREPRDLEQEGLLAVGGCRKCGRTFADRLDLIHHCVDHFPSLFYSFESRADLSPVLEALLAGPAAEPRPSAQAEARPADLTSSLPYHMCPHCCLTFADAHSFEDHLSAHSKQELLDPKLTCELCAMSFRNPYLLSEHKKLHARRCEVCGEAFTTIFDLNLHMGEHFDYPYNCKDCGRCFPCRKSLAEHNRSHRIVSAEPAEPAPAQPTALAAPKPDREKKARPAAQSSTAQCAAEDRPGSLLEANPYFGELGFGASRKRRSRAARTLRALRPPARPNDPAPLDLPAKLLQQLLMPLPEEHRKLLQFLQEAVKTKPADCAQ